jgi:hypothetical protein
MASVAKIASPSTQVYNPSRGVTCIRRARMLAKVTSLAVVGYKGAAIEVEVDISCGLTGFVVVGLPIPSSR